MEVADKSRVPVWRKELLTVKETAQLFSLGENLLRELASQDRNGEYVLRVGRKVLFKKKRFKEYLNEEYSV